jgi:uncharacterized protein YggE
MDPSKKLALDYRLIIGALLVVIIAMLFIWKPWMDAPSVKDRTITVTGEATVKAEPDEFLFSPSYQFKEANKEVALNAISEKSKDVVDGLKNLGVKDNEIQTNANSWSYPYYENNDRTPIYTLSLSVTVQDKDDLVQKVQDYLLGTEPTGTLTPSATFSKEKEKALETDARSKATQDAKNKAGQSAQNLGFSLGSVKTVDDGNGFGGPIYPLDSRATMEASGSDDKSASITVQPGENSLNYSVTVTYYIK